MIPYRVGFKLRVRLTWLSPPPRLPASPPPRLPASPPPRLPASPPPRLPASPPPRCWQAIRALMGYFGL